MTDHLLRVRAYCPDDLSIVSKIWFDASLQAHPFLGEARLREQRKLVEQIYLKKSESWVATRRDEVVGFIGLLDQFIGGIFVAPVHQSTGVGSALIAHALSLKSELMLEVYAANNNAVNFYTRLGFEEIARRSRDDEGLPFENIHMRLCA